jgi:hypothetical protein
MPRQFQWAANALFDTGLIVCRDCLDMPQDQFRALILPPDPVPRSNPRVSPNITGIPPIGSPLPTSPENLGFTQYVLGASGIPGTYPATKAAVLSQVAALSGITTPPVFDRSITIGSVNTSLALMAAQPTRNWLLLYNPVTPQVQVSETTATWGGLGQLILGPGEAYFWATAQNLGTPYQGALTVVGLLPMMPFWAWEGSITWLTDDLGNIITDDLGNPIALT